VAGAGRRRWPRRRLLQRRLFGDDAATLARAAQWRRENPDLAVRHAEFFHSLWDHDPGGAVAKEELLALARALAGLQA
jgi:hypothetical protein